MAVEMHFTEHDNVFVGEDKTFQFYVTTGLPIVVADSVENGDTTAEVHPLKETIANGTKLRFGNQLITLSAEATVGATSISFSAITGGIPANSVGYAVVNVSGWTTTFIVYATSGSTTALITKSGSVGTAANGVITATLAAADTASMTPKRYHYKFRRTDSGYNAVLAYGDLWLKG